jgi:formylglycine-generating enzyme required for sulfatase activity
MNQSLIRFLLFLIFTSPIDAPTTLAVTIDTVPIGNAGNAADVQPQGEFGAVLYDYRIGRTEVTNAEYVDFLNAVDPTGGNERQLYTANMTNDARGGINFSAAAANGAKYSVKTGRDFNPVVFVSYLDAIRFVNWLHNGQGSGDTETGAYASVIGERNTGALWFLPNENEWYKAAYHKNDDITGNYWDYPTKSDAQPDSDQPPGSDAPNPSNTANFLRDDALPNNYNDGFAVTGSTTFAPTQNYLTDVGAYSSSLGPYGTVDQGGNVLEWNETLFLDTSFRGTRGGSWTGGFSMAASEQFSTLPSVQTNAIGFRVATVATAGGLPGDYNQNGTVDAADYVVWRKAKELGLADLPNDDDTAGPISEAEYTLWRANFGETAASGAAASAHAAVPEPTTLLMFIVGMLAMHYCRRINVP